MRDLFSRITALNALKCGEVQYVLQSAKDIFRLKLTKPATDEPGGLHGFLALSGIFVPYMFLCRQALSANAGGHGDGPLREIAARTRDGEPLHKVLRSLAMRATNQDARWEPLAVPDDLQPGPGEVAVAIRTGSRSNGYTRKLIDRAGLQRHDDIGAWCGIVTRDVADKLAARAKITTATVVERVGSH